MRTTASRSALLGLCQAFPSLEWAERDDSEDSTRGRLVHAAGESMIKTGVMSVSPDIDDEGRAMADHLEVWISEHHRLTWRSEVAFAWDPIADTGRELQMREHRGYAEAGATDAEFCGTADVVDIEGSTATVYDFKTGWDVAYAVAQLRSLALMVARAHDLQEVTIVTVHVRADGVRTPPPVTLDVFALADVAEELRALFARIDGATPVPGGHCTDLHCPARLACPEASSAAMQVLPAEALSRFKMALLPESPEHAAWMLPRLKLAEEWIDTAKSNVKDLARNIPGGLPLEPGKVYAEVASKRRSASATKLEDLARRLGATDAQVEACFNEATIRQFREVKASKGRAA